jgi:hypothetical protein
LNGKLTPEVYRGLLAEQGALAQAIPEERR